MAKIRQGDWIKAETADTLVQGTVEVVTGEFVDLIDPTGMTYRVHVDEVREHTPHEGR